MVAILLFGGALGLAFYSGLERRCPLRLPESQRELGPLHEMTLRDVSVDLTNAGAEPLKITSFRNDCNCVEFNPETFTLPAGATRKVTLTIRPSFLPRFQQPDGTAKWDMILEPRVEGWPQRQLARWRLKGHVVRLFQDWPHQVALAGPALTGKPATVTVPYTLTQPIKELTVENPNPWIVATLETKDELSGQIRLAFHDYAAGYQKETLRLTGKLANGIAISSPPLLVQGAAEHLVQLEPAQILLGIVPVGQEATATLTLRTAPGVVLNEVKHEAPPSVVRVEESKSTHEHLFKLRLKVAHSGALEEAFQIHVHVNNRMKKSYSVPLVVHGDGR